MNGFLVVDKPARLTSHDVVAKVRRAAGRGTRVGHAGTLDPMATGVLVVCLGAATRLVEWATAADKQYQAEITLGIETTTYDRDGVVTRTAPSTARDDEIEAALSRLRGTIVQQAPAHSAVKVGGEPLYRAARRGEAVVAPSRQVTIHRLALVARHGERLELDVHCSKGTYVRSIAHDLGELLGCGAHLSALRRTVSGAFTLEASRPLESALALLSARDPSTLLPLEVGVIGMPRMDVAAPEVDDLRHGRPIGEASCTGELVRAHSSDGVLVAILEARSGSWWPRKVLAA